MKQFIRSQTLLLLPCLLISLLLFAACGGGGNTEGDTKTPEPTLIEPGLPPETPANEGDNDTDPQENPHANDFPDKGEAATVEDLLAARAKIESYYFDQTMPYLDAHVFMQVWYKDNNMRMLSSVDGYGLTESFYDYTRNTLTTYTPGSGLPALREDFDFTSPDAPDNPVMDDYSACTLLGTDHVDGQTCLLLETQRGDKLWVSTKYGFPLMVEFTDSMGSRFTVTYDNIRINTLSDADVLPPDNMEIQYNVRN